MTGREEIRAEPHGVLEAGAELDFTIARDIRVRRATGSQFVKEMLENAVAIFRGKTDRVQRQVEIITDLASILQVGGGRAVAVFILLPVAHEERVHVESCVFQQYSGHGGINATGERKDDRTTRHPGIINA